MSYMAELVNCNLNFTPLRIVNTIIKALNTTYKY